MTSVHYKVQLSTNCAARPSRLTRTTSAMQIVTWSTS